MPIGPGRFSMSSGGSVALDVFAAGGAAQQGGVQACPALDAAPPISLADTACTTMNINGADLVVAQPILGSVARPTALDGHYLVYDYGAVGSPPAECKEGVPVAGAAPPSICTAPPPTPDPPRPPPNPTPTLPTTPCALTPPSTLSTAPVLRPH